MTELRKQFEALPEIEKMLIMFYFSGDDNRYKAREYWYSGRVGFINGAWYAFQEQQKKIDSIKSKLSDIYDASDENETVAHLLDEIQEILK